MSAGEEGGLARWVPSGAGWAFLCAFLYLQLRLPTQDDPDVWWHLEVGAQIVRDLAVPTADTYSFTMPAGTPWTAHEWLSEVLLHLIDRAGGLPLLLVVRSLCLAAGVALGWQHAVRYVPPRSAYLAALTLFAASHACWSARPHIFSFLLTALSLSLLERWRRERGGRGPWIVAALMLPWANLHGGFAIGLGLMGLYAASAFLPGAEGPPARERGGACAALALGFALACINPQGPRLLLFPLRFMREDYTFISEWVATSGALSPVFVPLLLLMFLALAAARVRPPAAAILIGLALVALSLKAIRHVQFLGFTLCFLLPEQLASAAARVDEGLLSWRGLPPEEPERPGTSREESPRRWALPCLTALVVSAFSLSPAGALLGPRAARAVAPEAAVDEVMKHDPGGRTFNEYGWGGYLIWRWGATRPVFVDGRGDMYGVEFLKQEYLALWTAQEGWEQALARWKITSVLVAPDAPLVAVLRRTPGWREVYQDEVAVVLVRSPG